MSSILTSLDWNGTLIWFELMNSWNFKRIFRIFENFRKFSFEKLEQSWNPCRSHESLKNLIQTGNDGLNRECTVNVNYVTNHMLRMVRLCYILRQILDKRILNKQTSSQHGNSFETNSKSYYVISNRFNIEELSSRFNIHRDQGKNNWFWVYWHCEPNSRLCNHFPTGTFNRNTQAGMVKMVSKQLLQNTVVICIYTCQEDSNISSI